MKSKIFIAILVSSLVLFNVSCDDFLDVNHNPNNLEELPYDNYLLPAAEVTLGTQLMGWEFGFTGAFWVEYWTQNYTASQFKTLCNYEDEDCGGAYMRLTAGVLPDLKRIKTDTKDNPDDLALYYIAEALEIYTWQILTDVWGDIPYFEAQQGGAGVTSPAFDTQESIYTDLLSRVETLIATDATNSSIGDGGYDFIFGGDMAKWKLFANSLKLKLMLRLSETPSYNNANVLAFIQGADFLTESAMISGNIWDNNKEGKRHPFNEFQMGGANYFSTNVIACKSFIDYLNVNDDPRLATLFNPTSGGPYKGAFFGDYESKEDSDGNGTMDDKEAFSTANIPSDLDIMIISLWEVYFNIAEVYARANDLVNAKAYYELGVQASLAQHSISDNSIIADGGYAKWTATSTEAGIKQIAMQRWIANCNYAHMESFLERNRTKYPAVNEIDIAANRNYANANFPVGDITISVKGRSILGGNLPCAPLYSSDLVNLNLNANGKQRINVGDKKVWWNMKAGK